jgi:hypothetical protein
MSVDMFLKIDGIQGESTDASHADEIDIFFVYLGRVAAGGCGQRRRGWCRGQSDMTRF